VPNFYYFVLAASILCVFCSGAVSQRNNPYSVNPNSRIDPQAQPDAKAQPVIIKVGGQRQSATQLSKPLTEIYKIGVGDVLFINLKNAPNASGYYTVRHDGRIDFPLVGENPLVADKTVEQIETTLVDGVTLYANPVIEVKVREYASHKIKVSGMAERVGEKSLQREAMPLFAIRSDALVNSVATKVNIRRNDISKVETYDLRDEKTGDVLIYPGNSVEFTADGQISTLTASGYFYIAGEVNSTGQKQFTDGMTLFQAVIASGGAKGNPKKATLRRKNDKGMLNVAEYNLRAIRDGKASDPQLQPGDMIEISN
jgi:protein involved in polysaccharide export with SLBB domain